MANPQKENGFTAIANEIMEALIKYRIPGEKRQVLDCIIRMTYGYQRTEVEISNNKISQHTGLKRQNVIRSILWLESKRILLRIKKDSTRTKVLKFNKNYDEWVPSKKRPVRIKSDSKVRIKKDSKPKIVPIIVKEKKERENHIEISKKVLDRINELSGKKYRTYDPILKVLNSKNFIPRITYKDCISVVNFKWKDDYIREKYFTAESLFKITKFASKLDAANNDIPVNPEEETKYIRAGDKDILSNG